MPATLCRLGNHWLCPAVNHREFCPQLDITQEGRDAEYSVFQHPHALRVTLTLGFSVSLVGTFVISALQRNAYAINLGLFSTIMSWFLHPEGVAKKRDEVDSMVPDPTNPDVMVSNKR